MKPALVSALIVILLTWLIRRIAMATILKEFDISFASDYLKTVKMSEIEETPRYRSSLTLPMVSHIHCDMLELIIGVCSWSPFACESK